MHAFGGLYLDIDVHCFKSTEYLLSGHEVVLQLEDSKPKSLNNAVMASIPGHPFWTQVIELIHHRSKHAGDHFLGFRSLDTVLQTTGDDLHG